MSVLPFRLEILIPDRSDILGSADEAGQYIVFGHGKIHIIEIIHSGIVKADVDGDDFCQVNLRGSFQRKLHFDPFILGRFGGSPRVPDAPVGVLDTEFHSIAALGVLQIESKI
ncbi:hypothetical protein D3C73_548160 [compost metagenome]